MLKSLSRGFADRSAPKWRPAVRSRRARVGLESLESRMVLSTYTVDSLLDVSPPPGVTTLRQAIIAADNDNNTDPKHPDIINVTVDGTISLSSALPALTGSVSIQGPGVDSLTIQGDGKSDTILNLSATSSVSLSGVTLTSPDYNNAGVSVPKGASLTIQNDLFCELNTSANGGAILDNGGTVTVSRSTFLQDLSAAYGGALANQGGSLSISESTFNTCEASVGDGGAVYNTDDSAGDIGQLAVLDDTFVNNLSERFGGAIGLDLGSTSTVVDSTFTGNDSNFGGGAISLHGRANVGPQISLRVSGSTLTNNSSAGINYGVGGGGGLYVQAQSPELPVVLHDTIIAGNTNYLAPKGALPTNDVVGAVDPSSSFNLIGDGSVITGLTTSSNGNLIGTDANPLNARLGPLQNNGGPTQTIAPLPNSPAIDHGGPDPVGDDYTTTDQAGDPRIVIQPNSVLPVGGDGRDIGAIELATQAPTILTVNSTADANPPAGTLTLREAIEAANGTLPLSSLPASQVQVGSLSIDEIRFSVTGTIALASALPTIATGDSVLVEGPGVSSLMIQGDGLNDSIFTLAANASFTLAGLTLDGDQLKNAGISVGASSVLGVQNAVIQNTVTNNDGAAVFSQGGFVTVASTTVQGNLAIEDGGAIAGLGGSIGVLNSVFQNTTSLGNGGAIDSNDGSGNAAVVPCALTIANSTFTNNSALGPSGGGALFLGIGSVTSIVNSTFYRNSAGGRGGAIFTRDESVLTVVSSTLSGNADMGYGTGGIEVDPLSVITVLDTIVAGNFAMGSPGTPSDISGPLESTSGYDIIGDGSHINLTNGSNGNLVGTDLHPISAGLGPLGYYGGPTPTIPLLPGSLAIDAGNNVLAVNTNGYPLTTDQRGEPRFINGTVDIGAFESQGFILTPVNASTPQSATVGSVVANPLAVIVAAKNPIEPVNGGVVNFTVTAASNGASAALSASSAVIAGGRAGVSATANGLAGSYSVLASASGAPSNGLFELANQAVVAAVSVGWGSLGRSIDLYTAADGVRLLPAGRNNDLPWLDINSFTITFNTAVSLTAANVSVTGITVANYGPVTVTASNKSDTITLAKPINAADRVTITISSPTIAIYTRRVNVLPGDVGDFGVVSAQDIAIERDEYLLMPIPNLPLAVFADMNGDGRVDLSDYTVVRARVGTKLPPLW